jgi:hypothetical protein
MFLNTARVPWSRLRTNVTANDPDISLTARNYSDWPTENTVKLSKPPLVDANGLLIAFYGEDDVDEAAAYILWGRSRGNGPMQQLLAGFVTFGVRSLTVDPVDNVTPIADGFWADTITVVQGLFFDATNPIVKILDSGNNRIAMLKFDQTHIEDLYLEINDISTAASISAIITGY